MKVDKWTVQPAQMKHTARKYTMSSVVDSSLRRMAAEAGIADYKELLKHTQDNPEAYDGLTDAEREFYDTASLAGMWAMIAACIVPYIPLTERLTLPYETIEALSEAVMSENPHWFAQPDQEKKTEPQPPQSMNE